MSQVKYLCVMDDTDNCGSAFQDYALPPELIFTVMRYYYYVRGYKTLRRRVIMTVYCK